MKNQQYPIDSILAPLKEHLLDSNVIVSAPPGAGKSTQLPLYLLENLPEKRIIMLQPRRVVVRHLAAYLARQFDEEVGQTVGYQIRGEKRISAQTRLTIVTEAVLTRKLQGDAELIGTDIIIFDEFHERNIHSDFSLALCIEVQQALRDDLRLIVMSATLDHLAMKNVLPSAQHLITEGKMFPVDILYTEAVSQENIAIHCAQQALQCCSQNSGDSLVFLPTVSMIKRAFNWLVEHVGAGLVVHELYGQLEKHAQQIALEPDPSGRQKIILATNIAETSLTIENVTSVVDSGLVNVACFHLSTGLTELGLQRISKASANQRAGRAGRVSAGRCIRMWTHEQHQFLVAHDSPQILQEDLTSIVLAAAVWGTPLCDLALLTQPSSAQLKFAQQELIRIGALDEDGAVQPYAKQIDAFPCHPTLAHLILSFARVSAQLPQSPFKRDQIIAASCWAAAIVDEGLERNHYVRLADALQHMNRGTSHQLTTQAKRFAMLAKQPLSDLNDIPVELLAVCIAFAQPRRIGFYIKPHTVKLFGGRQASVEQVLPMGTWIVVVDAIYQQNEVRISRYEIIAESLVQLYFGDQIEVVEKVSIHPQHKQIQAKQESKLAAITVAETPIERPKGQTCVLAWTQYLRPLTLGDWPFSKSDQQWWRRVELALECLDSSTSQAHDEFGQCADTNACRHFIDLLSPQNDQLLAVASWQQLEQTHWAKMLHNHLPWPVQQYMQQHLPLQITLSNGFVAPLSYRENGSVVISVRLQKLFGCYQKIMVGDGSIPVVLELLSPANRPLQSTLDLAGFWQGSYQEIRKEMRGRYPKHNWDAPLP